jgi:hypothetical protein
MTSIGSVLVRNYVTKPASKPAVADAIRTLEGKAGFRAGSAVNLLQLESGGLVMAWQGPDRLPNTDDDINLIFFLDEERKER